MVYRSGGEWGPVLLAESRPSLQVRNRKGSAKKADPQGISQFFCCAAAANVLCGWLLHSKIYLIRFVHLSEAVMCPACLRGFDRWPSLSGHCFAIPFWALDGFRKPSSLQQCGLLRLGHSAECLGFGGRLMHHHLAGLANSLFFLL